MVDKEEVWISETRRGGNTEHLCNCVLERRLMTSGVSRPQGPLSRLSRNSSLFCCVCVCVCETDRPKMLGSLSSHTFAAHEEHLQVYVSEEKPAASIHLMWWNISVCARVIQRVGILLIKPYSCCSFQEESGNVCWVC